MATGRVPTTANSPLTAKGDLFTYSTAPARLAVGNNGEQIVADSSATTGLRYQGNYAAGKNKVINGDFRIAQRGTSFSIAAQSTYTLDRFITTYSTALPTAWTVSQQTFTPGTAPVSGYEGANYLRSAVTNIGTATVPSISHRIEDVRTFAGQSVTYSFWAKAHANCTISVSSTQVFGTGGSAAVDALATTSQAITTSWVRYSFTYTVPSISGKTIGTNSYINVRFNHPNGQNSTVDIWGLQLEEGSVATAFQTATGTLQGELAACQRYYYRMSNSLAYEPFGLGYGVSATRGNAQVKYATTLRTNPSSLDFANLALYDGATTVAVTNLTLDTGTSKDLARLAATTASGITQYRPYELLSNNSTSAYVGFSAEL